MKTIQIVYEFPFCGYSTSGRYAKCLVADFQGNMNEVYHDVAFNYDTAPGQGEDVNRYEVREKTIPDWMEPMFYVKHDDLVDDLFRRVCGVVKTSEMTEAQFKKFLTMRQAMSREAFHAIMDLVEQKTFRSDFRKSLRAQVDDWMANPSPKYDSPLSPKQIACLTRPHRF